VDDALEVFDSKAVVEGDYKVIDRTVLANGQLYRGAGSGQ